jgi:hypothetical protein
MAQRLNSSPEMVEDIQKQIANWKQKDPIGFEAARTEEVKKGKWQMGNHFNEPTKEFLTDLATIRKLDPNFKLFDNSTARSDANAGIEKAHGPNTKKVHDQVKEVENVTAKAAGAIKVGDVDKNLAGKVHTGSVAQADVSPTAVVYAAFNPGNHASRTLAAASTDTSPVIVEGLKLDAQHRNTHLQAPKGDKPAVMRTEKQMIGATAFAGAAVNAAAHMFHTPLPNDAGPGSAGSGNAAQQGQPPAAGTSAPQRSGSANPAQGSPSRPSRPARQGKLR